jgi:hypothetical protein
MKKVIVLIIILQSFLLIGQEPPKMPKYNAKNSANIFYYDLGEAVEKIKIKKDEIGNITKKALRVYNDKVKKTSFLNFQKLQELEVLVNTKGEQAMLDRDLGMEIRRQMQETILPIRDSIKKNEEELNKTLKVVLSKKQYKKWLKHQNNKKKELLPKRPQSNNNSAPPPMQNNRQRGMGRGGF